MSNLLPEGYLVNVTMKVRVPIAATVEQINEWLSYELACAGGGNTEVRI